MIFVTAKKGKNHVTSQQFRGIVAAMAGTESYIADMDEHLEPELAVNNTIKIRSGTLIHHGGVMVVKSGTYDEVTYQNGTQAMKRIDLVVARYTQDTATGTENAEWVVIQGQPAESNPVAPDYIHGNMQDGDLADDCPIFELHFDGINVTEVRKLINIMQSVDELNRKLNEGFFPLTSDINGIFKYPNGLMLQWGIYPSAAMTKNDGVGGYIKEISFKEVFIGSPQVFTTCHYWGGNTQTGTQNVSSNSVTLYSKSAAADLGVRWLALGSWK